MTQEMSPVLPRVQIPSLPSLPLSPLTPGRNLTSVLGRDVRPAAVTCPSNPKRRALTSRTSHLALSPTWPGAALDASHTTAPEACLWHPWHPSRPPSSSILHPKVLKATSEDHTYPHPAHPHPSPHPSSVINLPYFITCMRSSGRRGFTVQGKFSMNSLRLKKGRARSWGQRGAPRVFSRRPRVAHTPGCSQASLGRSGLCSPAGAWPPRPRSRPAKLPAPRGPGSPGAQGLRLRPPRLPAASRHPAQQVGDTLCGRVPSDWQTADQSRTRNRGEAGMGVSSPRLPCAGPPETDQRFCRR